MSLAEELRPACWSDDERMNALFAPFRRREMNPRDYDSKMAFWKQLIGAHCKHCGDCRLSLAELRAVFARNSLPPACLATVLDSMLAAKEITPLEEFSKVPPKTWSGWAFDLAKKPVSWSLGKLKPPNVAEGRFVHVAAASELGQKLLQAVPDQCRGKVLELEEVARIATKNGIKASNVSLQLHALALQKKVDLHSCSKLKGKEVLLVKFSSSDQESVEPISEIDVGVYSLQRNEKLLLDSIAQLEEERDGLVLKAKQYLAKGMRPLAKGCLKQKHDVEKRLERSFAALDNVRAIWARSRDAEADGQVLQAYRDGLAALKTTMGKAGLDIDSADDTMDDLAEVVGQHEDIKATLGRHMVSDIDETGLEEELAELLKAGEEGGGDGNNATPPRPPSPKKKDEDGTEDLERRLRALRSPEKPQVKERLPVLP